MKKGQAKLKPEEVRSFVSEYLETNSYSEVARRYDKNPSTIKFAVTKFQLEQPEEYKKIYDLYLQKSEEKFIQTTTNVIDKIANRIAEKVETDENSISQLSTTLGILYDKRQLSRGKSTSNSAIVIQMSGDIQELSK